MLLLLFFFLFFWGGGGGSGGVGPRLRSIESGESPKGLLSHLFILFLVVFLLQTIKIRSPCSLIAVFLVYFISAIIYIQ